MSTSARGPVPGAAEAAADDPSDDLRGVSPIPSDRTLLRAPAVADAAAIWRTARDAGTLDLNSPYAYLLLCHHHADACVVAEDDTGIAGFVVGYRPPTTPDVVFVWQVAVAPRRRGGGLASRLLDHLLAQARPLGVQYLEATVTPSNAASRRLFGALARRSGGDLQVTGLFTAEQFPSPGHEDEHLFRIGPLPVPAPTT